MHALYGETCSVCECYSRTQHIHKTLQIKVHLCANSKTGLLLLLTLFHGAGESKGSGASTCRAQIQAGELRTFRLGHLALSEVSLQLFISPVRPSSSKCHMQMLAAVAPQAWTQTKVQLLIAILTAWQQCRTKGSASSSHHDNCKLTSLAIQPSAS